MEYVIILLGLLSVILGFVGSFMPGPGALFSILGLVALRTISEEIFSSVFFWILIILLVLTFVIDFAIPAITTKRFGGSKYGAWGAFLLPLLVTVAMFFVTIPGGFILSGIIGLAMIVGANFFGPFIGEMLHNPKNITQALKASYGSFVGFCAATFIKMVVGIIVVIYYCVEVVKNWDVLFQ